MFILLRTLIFPLLRQFHDLPLAVRALLRRRRSGLDFPASAEGAPRNLDLVPLAPSLKLLRWRRGCGDALTCGKVGGCHHVGILQSKPGAMTQAADSRTLPGRSTGRTGGFPPPRSKSSNDRLAEGGSSRKRQITRRPGVLADWRVVG
jgi:hypothetical protein